MPDGTTYEYKKDGDKITVSWNGKDDPPDITKYVFSDKCIISQLHKRDGSITYYNEKGIPIKLQKKDGTWIQYDSDGKSQ